MAVSTFPDAPRRMFLAGVLALVPLLAASCTTMPPIAGSSTGISGQQTASDGSGSATGTGTAAVPPNVLTVPGLPIPPNAAVMMDQTIIIGGGEDDSNWTGQVMISAPGYEPIQIVEFMRSNMGRYGWTETSVIWSSKTSMTFVRAARFATLRILTTSKGSLLDIVVAPLQAGS